MSIHHLGTSHTTGTFIRLDGHSMELGMTIVYKLEGLNFAIIASRNGVELAGRFPCVDRRGVVALQDMLTRAARHHEHLQSFPLGEKQVPLPEEVLEEEEKQRDAMTVPSGQKVM